MKNYVIDGTAFRTLEEFAAHFSTKVLNGYEWRGNLDALNDILRGGFGTPDNGFALIWHDSDVSRENLGYRETIRQLEMRLARCHPSNRIKVESELAAARRRQGPTVFDWLVEIIENHGPNGAEREDRVELLLQ